MKWLASIGLSGTVLALFAAITSVAIGWTYLGTKAQIDLEVRRAEARQLLEIFPPDTHDNEIVDDVFQVAPETRRIVGRGHWPVTGTSRLVCQQLVL